jgi:hypothetical protein
MGENPLTKSQIFLLRRAALFPDTRAQARFPRQPWMPKVHPSTEFVKLESAGGRCDFWFRLRASVQSRIWRTPSMR